ncbi:hypothetical protein [Streptomyces sp. NBC_01506]|uniref:hypothetical protein n=1 Tax=Streptomyces sp. NBC_01506 TaxID=2903887 RepID=UPI00386BBD33
MPPTEQPEPAAPDASAPESPAPESPAPDSPAPDASSPPAPTPGPERAGGRVDRRGTAVGAVITAACAALVLYGVFDTPQKRPAPKRPTAAVTYEVTGEGVADLTYQARSASGKAVVVRGVSLPWKKTVRVPLGKPPIVTITLDAKGGRATCALAVRGRHVQTATAYGTYGRATCQGELPAPESTTDTPVSAQGE